MSRQLWLRIPLLLLLLASMGLNVVLYRFAEDQFREVRKVRLDPISERRFEAENAALSPPGPGVARIIFFGDSRIADWEDLPDVPGTQIVNRGRGGETTEQMLLRLERDVIGLSPDVVVLQAGVNDLASLGVLPNRAEGIVETCRSNLERIITRMQEADIRVVVMTILPAGRVPLQRRPVWSERTRDAIEALNDQLRSADYTGTGSVVVDVDAVIAEGRRMKPSYELDTLHVNASGYEVLNTLLEPILADLVEGIEGSG